MKALFVLCVHNKIKSKNKISKVLQDDARKYKSQRGHDEEWLS